MSKGDSKVTKIFNAKGEPILDRTPAKPLQESEKVKLLSILKRNDIAIEISNEHGVATIVVKETKNKQELFIYNCAWGHGYYNIVDNLGVKPTIVAEMDWYDSDKHTNPAQQAIFDIANAIEAKRKELCRTTFQYHK